MREATTSTMVNDGSQRSIGNQTDSANDARASQLGAGGGVTLIANDGVIMRGSM